MTHTCTTCGSTSARRYFGLKLKRVVCMSCYQRARKEAQRKAKRPNVCLWEGE